MTSPFELEVPFGYDFVRCAEAWRLLCMGASIAVRNLMAAPHPEVPGGTRTRTARRKGGFWKNALPQRNHL